MTRDHRRDVLTLLAIAIVGALLIVGLIARGPHVVHNPLTAIPTNAFVVVTVDVRALAVSPLGAAIVGEKGAHAGALFGVDSIEATCGFDPLPRLEAVAISVPEGDTHGELGIAVSGDLPKGALMSCAKALIEKRGGRWSLRESGQYSIVSENREHGAEIAFREGGPFLVGRGEWLEKMIDSAEGRAKSMALPNDDLQHTLRNDMTADDPDANAIVATAVLPRELRDRISREMTGGSEGANATMQAVLGVSGAAFAIHAGRGHDETRFAGELRCDGASADADAACKKVETLILHERLQWSGDLRLRLFGLGALIDGLQTRVDGGSLTLHTSAPSDGLARMISRLLDAPPRTAPPPGAPKPDDLVHPVSPSGSASAPPLGPSAKAPSPASSHAAH